MHGTVDLMSKDLTQRIQKDVNGPFSNKRCDLMESLGESMDSNVNECQCG